MILITEKLEFASYRFNIRFTTRSEPVIYSVLSKLKDKQTEETTGADVTSFRFYLSDGTTYELIYVCNGVKNGKLKSETGGFEYFTSADIGSYWDGLNDELEAIPVNESELPRYKN